MFRLMFSDCVATSNPATVALPDVGAISPHRMRIVVDFPAPFGPRNPKISPCRTSIDTLSTATKSPKRLVRLSILTAGPFESSGTRCFLSSDVRDEHIFKRWQNRLPLESRGRCQCFHRRYSSIQEQ